MILELNLKKKNIAEQNVLKKKIPRKYTLDLWEKGKYFSILCAILVKYFQNFILWITVVLKKHKTKLWKQ